MTFKQSVTRCFHIPERNQELFANKLILCSLLVGIALRSKEEWEKRNVSGGDRNTAWWLSTPAAPRSSQFWALFSTYSPSSASQVLQLLLFRASGANMPQKPAWHHLRVGWKYRLSGPSLDLPHRYLHFTKTPKQRTLSHWEASPVPAHSFSSSAPNSTDVTSKWASTSQWAQAYLSPSSCGR